MTGKELHYISEAHFNGKLAGDGPFTDKCHQWLENKTTAHKVLLTHSCTSALEMTALLLGIREGDEIIMPSYTFVSTANAFVMRGAVPVFVDIRPDTLNIDESLIESAITCKTKAIVPVHYAGVSCEMDKIMKIATKHQLFVVEDAAQGIMSSFKGRALGSIGHFGTYSFHETKNVISGEGGALIINDQKYSYKAEVIREKGTDRSRFLRGEVDKYTWQNSGSSFLPGELIAAFLWAQLQEAESITKQRLASWYYYHELLVELEERKLLRRPIVPEHCEHNAHMYYILLNDASQRDLVLSQLKANNIHAVFHYIPLHNSPAGKKFGRTNGTMVNTEQLTEQIIRLPLWVGISKLQQEMVVKVLSNVLSELV